MTTHAPAATDCVEQDARAALNAAMAARMAADNAVCIAAAAALRGVMESNGWAEIGVDCAEATFLQAAYDSDGHKIDLDEDTLTAYSDELFDVIGNIGRGLLQYSTVTGDKQVTLANLVAALPN
ncbi:hypothetical protein ACFQNE_03260 [Gordonia phosphorivorans]|uniref:Uncharacterized protein n=1 Tax=Gordonia phosphorivorans TaxID=1056982 RepID=A0ABV6H3T8_9ACTN